MPNVAPRVRARGATVFGVSRAACVMPFKTFAHGWATLPAMDRSGDDGRVIIEWADERMLAQELERLLLLGPLSDELSHGTESVTLV